MSRILKFRVWDEKYNEWETKSDITFLYPSTEIKKQGRVLQQFTGLLDKNKDEIYEGDIVKFDISGVPHGPEREVGEIGEVWFDEEFGCWSFGKKACGYSLFDRLDKKSLEVIGNIFETPERLKNEH